MPVQSSDSFDNSIDKVIDKASQALLVNPSMTRRTLFSATAVVGALCFIGSACGGRVLAYADDETGDTHFVIVLMSKEEISVQVVNLASPSGTEAVPNANIVITSRYNDKIATGVTDKDGIAIINVKTPNDLTRESDPEEAGKTHRYYTMYCSADVTIDNFRGFAYTRQYVQTGAQSNGQAHILLGTQPFNPATDKAYLRMACFDGNDMLYKQADMPKFSDNTINHLIEFQVGCAAGKEASIAFYGDKTLIGGGKATANEKGIAYISFESPVVANFAVGTKFSAIFTADGYSQTVDLTLVLSKPEIDLPGMYYSENWAFSMGSGAGVPSSNDTEGEMDSSVPYIKNRTCIIPTTPWGQSLTIMGDLPWFPVDVVVDPRGGIGVAHKCAYLSLFSKFRGSPASGPDVDMWKQTMKHPAQSWADLFSYNFKESSKQFSDTAALLDQGHAIAGNWGFGINLGFYYEFGLMAYFLDWEGKRTERWEGTAYASASLIFMGNLGAQVFIGPFPVVVSLDFLLQASPMIETGVSCKPILSDLQFVFLSNGIHGAGGFIVNITADAGLTVGVGVRGLAYVGVRGYFTMPMAFTFHKEEGKAFPHKDIKLIAGVQLVAQICFISIRADVLKPKTWTIYDNWPSAQNFSEEGEYIDDFYADDSYSIGNVEQYYTNDLGLKEAAEITADLNEQGVLCCYDTSGVALPSLEGMESFMVDPFTANGAYDYDPRKGLKPNIEVPFSSDSSNGEKRATNIFSDNRLKIVQLGNVLYYCLVKAVQVNINSGNTFHVVNDQGDCFFIPDLNSAEDTLPTLDYVEPDEQGANGTKSYGKFVAAKGSSGKVLEYADVKMYNEENCKPTAPVISQIDVPISDSNDLEQMDEYSPESLNDCMKAIADALTTTTAINGSSWANAQPTYRTRVVVCPYDMETRKWGSADVIDFNIPSRSENTLRCDMYDVDFTPVADEESDSILFGLVSMTKPYMQTRDLETMKKDLFTSVLRYKPAFKEHGEICDVHTNVGSFLTENNYEWKAIPFNIGNKIGVTATGVMGKNVIVHHFFNASNDILNWEETVDKLTVSDANAETNQYVIFPDSEHSMNDNGILNTFVDGNNIYASWQYADGYVGQQGGPVQASKERATVWSCNLNDGCSLVEQKDFNRAENFVVLGPQKGFAYLTRNDKNTEVKMYNVRTDGKGGLQSAVDLGYSSTGRFFTSGEGNMLYGFRIQEGVANQLSGENLETLKSIKDAGGKIYENESGFSAVDTESWIDDSANGTPKVQQYQVIAARWDSLHGRYREFFPYATLNKRPDDAEAYPLKRVGRSMGGTSVVYNKIENLTAKTSTLYSVEITPVVGLGLLSSACFDSFINTEKEWTIHPTVRVHNIGNTPISAFTVSFTVNGSDLVDPVRLDHLENFVSAKHVAPHEQDKTAMAQLETSSVITMTDTNGNNFETYSVPVEDEEWGKEDEAILWPGSERTYTVPITIRPDSSWQKSTHVTVEVSNPEVPNLSYKNNATVKDTNGLDLSCLMFDNEPADAIQEICGNLGSENARTWNVELGSAEIKVNVKEEKPIYYETSDKSAEDGKSHLAKTSDDSLSEIAKTLLGVTE